MKLQTNISAYVLGSLLVCLLATTPCFSQEKALERTLAQTLMEQRINHFTDKLFSAISDMVTAKTDAQRDAILQAAQNALANGADVHAKVLYADNEELTVLELIVHHGLNFNAGYFANLYNLVISYGANPFKDLQAPYDKLAKKLPLEESQEWEKIRDASLVPTAEKLSTPQERSLTICIPQEYNKYSCKKLKKMKENGTLPEAQIIYNK